MDVTNMSWVEVLANLGGSSASYKLESAGGRVKLAVDGIAWPKAGRRQAVMAKRARLAATLRQKARPRILGARSARPQVI